MCSRVQESAAGLYLPRCCHEFPVHYPHALGMLTAAVCCDDAWLHDLSIQLGAGNTTGLVHDDLRQWCEIMKTASRCGLGKTACNTPVFAIDKFGEYFDPKLDTEFDGLNHKFNLEEAVKWQRKAVKQAGYTPVTFYEMRDGAVTGSDFEK